MLVPFVTPPTVIEKGVCSRFDLEAKRGKAGVSNTIDLGSGDDRLGGTPGQVYFYLLRMGVPT